MAFKDCLGVTAALPSHLFLYTYPTMLPPLRSPKWSDGTEYVKGNLISEALFASACKWVIKESGLHFLLYFQAAWGKK